MEQFIADLEQLYLDAVSTQTIPSQADIATPQDVELNENQQIAHTILQNSIMDGHGLLNVLPHLDGLIGSLRS